MARRVWWSCAVLVLLVVLTGDSHGADDVCTRGICQCNRDPFGSLAVNCNNGRLTGVPDRIPADAWVVNLAFNSLSRIESNAFHTLGGLHRLILSDNNISHIAPAGFRNLHKLEVVDLESNSLSDMNQLAYGDLLGVNLIKLQANRISFIQSTAFEFSQNISEIGLKDSGDLSCDCETKALRDWAQESSPLVILEGATCGGRPLFEVPDEDFGNCSKPTEQQCWTCEDQPSLSECLDYGSMKSCANDELCSLTITTREEVYLYSSGCEMKSECISKMVSNVEQCKQAANYQKCQFCCSTEQCDAEKLVEGYSYTMYFTLEFVLQHPYTTQLNDSTSSEHQDLSQVIRTEISNLIADTAEKSYTGAYVFHKAGDHTGFFTRVTSQIPMTTSYLSIQHDLYNRMTEDLNSGSVMLKIDTDTIIIRGKTTCPAERHDTDKGEFRWPTSSTGYYAIFPCPVPRIGNDESVAVRLCAVTSNGTAEWQDAITDNCADESERTRELKDLVNTPVSQENMLNMTERLANLTDIAEAMTQEEVELSVRVIDNIVWSNNSSLSSQPVAHVLRTFNNIMKVEEDVLLNLEELHSSTSRILRSIDHLAEVVKLENSSGTTLVEKEIAMSFVPVNAAFTGATFVSFPGIDGDLSTKSIQLRVNQTSIDSDKVESALSIPAAVFEGLQKNSTNLQFVIYENIKFFEVIEAANKRNDSKINLDPHTLISKVNSKVISAKFQQRKIVGLSNPVIIHLRHVNKQYGDNPECVFWSYEATENDHEADWSPFGCLVAKHVPTEYTVCHCNHLTSFGAIMDIYNNSGSIDEANRKALSIISYVGCAVSLVALIATVTTYTMFRKLRADNPSKILLNLCCAIIGLLVLFIISTLYGVRKSNGGCKAVAALLHYCLLSTWMWMAVEAFYMYLALVKVFKTYYSKFILKCSLVGWGIPALVVVITIAISRENYGSQGEICWLARNAFYGAALAPIAIILILNFVAFGLVIRQLRTLSSRKLEKSNTVKMDVQAQLKGAFGVVVLLGLTWIFAVFAIGQANLVFQYLFSIFNSLQGLFIFIFYCVMKKDVIYLWRKKLTGQLSSTHQSSSKGYTSSTPMYGGTDKKYKVTTTDSPVSEPKIDHSRWSNQAIDDSWKTKL